MSRHTPYLLAAGCSLLLGCQSSQRNAPPSRIKLPFDVEIVPKRPFEREFDISGVPDQDELLRRVGEALRGKGIEPDCIAPRGGQLRVMGRLAFAAVAPVLAKHKLLGPLASQLLNVRATQLSVELGHLPRLGLEWSFMAHTNRASDIVQYARLDGAQAGELLERFRQDCRAEVLYSRA